MTISTPTNFQREESKTTEKPGTAVLTGTGGDIMSSWDSRSSILNNLLTASFTNQSSFSIPASVFEGASFGTTESKRTGILIESDFRDSDSTPIAGDFIISDADGVFSESSVSGYVTEGLPLPAGLTSGSSVSETTSYSVRFEPLQSAIPYEVSGISSSTDLGQIAYGSITGTVTDVNGDPVESDRVTVGPATDFTDENGEYTVKGPSGQSEPVEALRGSFNLDFTFTGKSETVQDLQYGGIEYTVTIPNGDAVSGVEVTTTGQPGTAKKTDSNGTVKFDRVNTSGDIELNAASISQNVSPPDQGSVANIDNSVGIGISGNILDGGGNAVRGLSIGVDVDNALKAEIRDDGSFTVGADDSGGVSVKAGENDRRYITEEIELDIPDGEVEDNVEIRLEEKESISTF